MPSLRFTVADIPEEGLEFTRQVMRDEFLPEENDPDTCDDFTVSCTATMAGPDILVLGKLIGTLRLDCVRCLDRFQRPFCLSFEGLYGEETDATPTGVKEHQHHVEEAAPDEIERYPIQDECIELGSLLREQVILSIPMQPLCSEECRGLCSQCGENLNVRSCDCAPVVVASPFSVLQHLVKASEKPRTSS